MSRNKLVVLGVFLMTIAFIGTLTPNVSFLKRISNPEGYWSKEGLTVLENKKELYVYHEAYEYTLKQFGSTAVSTSKAAVRECPRTLRLFLGGTDIVMGRLNPQLTRIFLTCNGESGKEVGELQAATDRVDRLQDYGYVKFSIFAFLVSVFLFVASLYVKDDTV